MTLSTLFTDDLGAIALTTVIGGALSVWYLLHTAKHNPGWKGVAARVVVAIGSVALIVGIVAVSVAFIAIVLTIGAVFLFMVPLFLIAAASGTVDRRPRRGYYRNRYDNDYY